MHRLKPIVCNTPEELAAAMGSLRGRGERVAAPACAAQAPEGNCGETRDHACRGRQTGGHFTNKGYRDSQWRPRSRVQRFAGSHLGRVGI